MARKATTPRQSKAESITVRLDPKIRYGLELLARKQRRTLSSVVEWSLQKAIDSPEDGLIEKNADGTDFHLLNLLWDVEEPDRLYNLASWRSNLLTFEEEKLVKAIIESDYFHYLNEQYKHLRDPETGVNTSAYHQKIRENLREHFKTYQKVASGELGKDALPKPPRNWSKPKPKKPENNGETA